MGGKGKTANAVILLWRCDISVTSEELPRGGKAELIPVSHSLPAFVRLLSVADD